MVKACLAFVNVQRNEDEIIGTALRRIRLIFDYSASEMSSMLGISRSYLSEIENNTKQPTMRILERYADVTGIKLSSIMLLAEQYDGGSNEAKARLLTSKVLNSVIENMAVNLR